MQSGVVKGLPKMAISTFHATLASQGNRVACRKSIPKVKSTMTTIPLQFIHSDVAGPFHVKSLRGAEDFLTFIDNFSKKT